MPRRLGVVKARQEYLKALNKATSDPTYGNVKDNTLDEHVSWLRYHRALKSQPRTRWPSPIV